MVLTGYINKEIIPNLIKRNITALGMSGIDGKLIEAKKYNYYENKKIDLGYVGVPTKLNNKFLTNFYLLIYLL